MPPAGHTYVLNQKLLSLSGDLWIEDEQGNNAFQVDGKAFSLRRTLILLDPSGNPLYAIGKSPGSSPPHVRDQAQRCRGGDDPGGARQLPRRSLHDHLGDPRSAERQGQLHRP
jgi:hypothetical protein